MQRQISNGQLILALAILSLAGLSMHTAAQRPRPERAPAPTQKVEPTPTPLPDLVPDLMHWSVAASAISLYNPDIDVVLDVDNRADVGAPTSVATVVFKVNGANQSVSQPVAPVPAHGTSRATFRVPKGCFDPVAHSCYHTVTVDSANQVPESNEANNTDSGYELLANVSGITKPPTEKAQPTPTPLPDLVFDSQPHLVLSPSSLSRYNPVYDVEIEVENDGYVAAPESMVTAVFQVNGKPQSSSQPVSAIPGRGTGLDTERTVRFRVPNGCFDPADQLCRYTITVDSGNQVLESNEGNNTISGQSRRPSQAPPTRSP